MAGSYVVAVGSTSSLLDHMDKFSKEGVLLVLDRDGNFQWCGIFGIWKADVDVIFTSVKSDGDSIYVAGLIENLPLIIKFGIDDRPQLIRVFGVEVEYEPSLNIVNEHLYLLTKPLKNFIGMGDTFIAVLTRDSVVESIWALGFKGSQTWFGRGLLSSYDDKVVLTGSTDALKPMDRIDSFILFWNGDSECEIRWSVKKVKPLRVKRINVRVYHGLKAVLLEV